MAEAAGQGGKLNVFISYSRDDLAFADQLDAALGLAGFGTSIDRQGIAGGEEWESASALSSVTPTRLCSCSPRHLLAPKPAPGRSREWFGLASGSFPCCVARSRGRREAGCAQAQGKRRVPDAILASDERARLAQAPRGAMCILRFVSMTAR